MSDFKSKIITIAEYGMTNGRHSVKDIEGIKYSFFETKQDGTPTKAFANAQKIGLKQNLSIKISYTENTKHNDQLGKDITYRNIASISIPNENESSEVPFRSPSEMKFKAAGEDEKWEKIRNEKESNIREMNARNCATELVKTFYQLSSPSVSLNDILDGAVNEVKRIEKLLLEEKKEISHEEI